MLDGCYAVMEMETHIELIVRLRQRRHAPSVEVESKLCLGKADDAVKEIDG